MALAWAWCGGEEGRNGPHCEVVVAGGALSAWAPGCVRRKGSESFQTQSFNLQDPLLMTRRQSGLSCASLLVCIFFLLSCVCYCVALSDSSPAFFLWDFVLAFPLTWDSCGLSPTFLGFFPPFPFTFHWVWFSLFFPEALTSHLFLLLCHPHLWSPFWRRDPRQSTHTQSHHQGKGFSPLECHLTSLKVGPKERDFHAESPYGSSECSAMSSPWELGPLLSQGSGEA